MTRKRSILLMLLVVVVIAAWAKSHRESEWHGLTESEARSKLDAKLPDMIPAEKRSAISDKVVAKMRDRGVISEDPVVPNDVNGVADDEDQLATH